MYSKSYILLLIANTVCALLLMFSRESVVQAEYVQNQETVQAVTEQVELEKLESLERIISYDTLKQSFCIDVSEQDLDTLMRIVEAEAGGEDRKGKLLVANVVINRVRNKKFPDNVTDVVYQKDQNVTQFSPVSNGTIDKVKVSEETKEAVYSALRGEDVSDGALFFMARKYADPENAEWFDSHLTFLFSYGGHDFYKR
ncbi:MAG: cell wall hydrolase [Lachnospiraceae bacterium]|nr:cell wall hydrolase [Lachnospiraceae bacterium]